MRNGKRNESAVSYVPQDGKHIKTPTFSIISRLLGNVVSCSVHSLPFPTRPEGAPPTFLSSLFTRFDNRIEAAGPNECPRAEGLHPKPRSMDKTGFWSSMLTIDVFAQDTQTGDFNRWFCPLEMPNNRPKCPS